jgi:uncharacterized protein (TIGR02145 family)
MRKINSYLMLTFFLLTNLTFAQDGNPCPDIPIVEYEGKTYNTAKIGDQCWFKENLNYETADSWCYDDNPDNCAEYGRLYTWEAAMNGSISEGAQGICPDGWRIPTRAEFEELKAFVGDEALKLVREDQPATAYTPTNETGFSALFAGYGTSDDFFYRLGYITYFWSSTEFNSGSAYGMSLHYGSRDFSISGSGEEHRYSVRCIRDIVTSINNENNNLNDFTLDQNYPNPFNPSTTIRYSVAEPTNVTLVIYNSLGEKVKTLVDEHNDRGFYDVFFNGDNLPSGFYYYQIVTSQYVETKKMVLIK